MVGVVGGGCVWLVWLEVAVCGWWWRCVVDVVESCWCGWGWWCVVSVVGGVCVESLKMFGLVLLLLVVLLL